MLKFKSDAMKRDSLDVVDAIQAFDVGRFRSAKILITGATGLIGLNIVGALHALNEKYGLEMDLFCASRSTSQAAEYISEYLDISDINFVEYGREEVGGAYDFIFHAASSTNPVDLATKPLEVIHTNVTYTFNLLKLLTPQTGMFVFFSTREIYGKKVTLDKPLVDETDYGALSPLDTRSAYPESKRMAENIIACHGMQFGNPYRIFRISHTYGPGMKLNDGRVLSDIIGAMASEADIKLNSDGSHKISPTYVSDVISGVLFGILVGEEPCYNVSNHNEIYSVLQISNIAAMYTGINVTHLPASAPTNLYLKHDTGILDSTRICDAGFRFRVPLPEGLRRVSHHFAVPKH